MKRALRLSIVFSVSALTLIAATSARADSIERRVRIASDVIIDRQQSLLPIGPRIAALAKCVASLKVVKAGLIWGGEGSTGLISCRYEDGQWSAPSFFNTGGVNFGVQIGVQFLQSVLLFISPHSQNIVEHGSFQLGSDLSVAAGPVGGGSDAGVVPDAAVLTYDKAVGLYAGATVNGFVIEPAPQRNHAVYGDDATAATILHTHGSDAPDVVQPFVEALNDYLK